MFDTSIDVLYGVISLCIIIFTLFLAWIMFYIVQILKQGNEVITDIREKIAEFEEALASIKERVMTSADTISMVASEVGSVVEFVRNFKDGGSKSKRRSKK